MIATYPDRSFQVWDYRVSHGSLLIRSPKGPRFEHNIDLVFVGVDYLSIATILRGVALEQGSQEELAATGFAWIGSPGKVYALTSANRRHLIAAAGCRVDENDGDIFDTPSEFPRWGYPSSSIET